ncbi:alpha/beta fold hydrolase [Texcoconibacillus texcoconensis]|uniref:Serine aminopeptidase S33 domain-containing protein n=1 Tax=Texcoconibacillus texcoconensis TaxID=1095777 RepID=A0A840QSP8_9BACI|nr:alpha/beta fold hydrolase [Texcoconibacillus texcoconensis]MBB5174333.1 hypothetical protein [Texcoconibacillus texcoconensis]
MTVNIRTIQRANIPVLEVVPCESENHPRPLILFYHGFTSAKEHNLHYAYRLARNGYRVLLPDAIYHGDRQAHLSHRFELYFWNIVIQTIEEMDAIVADVREDVGILDDRIGVFGTSMGAIITLGALRRYPWVRAGASLMGAPDYEAFAQWQLDGERTRLGREPLSIDEKEATMNQLRKYSIVGHLEDVKHIPFFFWHGYEDNVVPNHWAQECYNRWKEIHIDPDALVWIGEPGVGHKVSRTGFLKVTDWMGKHV